MSSVRSRFDGSNNNSNEIIGRSATGDFIGLSSRDGLVSITGRIENGRGFRWKAHCSAPTCNCDFVVEHSYLVNGGELRCVASGHSATLIVERRTYEAGVYEQQKPEARLSARDRQEAAVRQAEIAQLEKESNEN